MTTIPTLSDIYLQIISDLETEFGITINAFGNSFLRADSAALAAEIKLFYLALGELQKNIWVDTADPVEVGGTLQRFGFTKLQRYPFPATQGKYICIIAGTTGATIPALTQFKSNDTALNPGYLFQLDDAYVMPGSLGTIALRALTAGTIAALDITDKLTAQSPIINVNSSAVVTAIAVSPVAAETTEEYRAKVEQAYRASPQGGAPVDYRLWGSDAAGVQQIYPYAASGEPNEINVFVEAILADSMGPPYKGVPTTTILNNVTADIETDPVTGVQRRPLGVFMVNVAAINPLDVDITIDSGGTITIDQQTTITQALTEAIYLIRPFIAGIDVAADRNDIISQYGIGTTILQAIGSVIIASIQLDVNSVTVTSYQFDNGEIPYLNSVTYI